MSYFPGTAGPDSIVGGTGPDTLYGFAGDDTLDGQAGDDFLIGGEGGDLLLGGPGNDTLQGDLLGGGGNDTLNGGTGTDTARYQLAGPAPGQGASFDASAIGTAANLAFADGHGGIDRLESIEQVEVVGSAYDDRIVGSTGSDWLRGEEGDDLIVGGMGQDLLQGGSGNDTLRGGEDHDILRAGAGDDLLEGGEGNDTLYSDWGSNTLVGGLGLDKLHYSLRQATRGVNVDIAALRHADHVLVDHGLGGGVDRLESIEQLEFYGSEFDDTIAGGPMDDLLHGDAGHDTVRFQGRASEYGFTFNPRTGQITVVDSVLERDGSDRVFGFESYVFADRSLDREAVIDAALPLGNATPLRTFRVAQEGSGQPGVDNLLSGGSSIFVWGESARSGVTLSTSFATAETLRNDLTGDDLAQPFPTQWVEHARRAMQAVASVADVRFVELDDRGANVGEVRWLAEGDPTASASATGSPPGPFYGSSNVRVNVPRMPTTDPGLTMLLMHELGHALGLVHPHDGLWPAPVEDDQLRHSLMSYRGFAGGPLYQMGNHVPTSLMPNDIRALQWLYGANVQSRSGDDVYRWPAGRPIYETIYDTGGQDTVDASNQALGVQLSLKAGDWSVIGAPFFDGQSIVRDRLVIFDETASK